ncbi:MAG: alpha/beta hydrolase, partial [Janthinobacterium sp.]
YPELRMPVSIVAGREDAIVSASYHSARLHEELDNSELTLLPGAGHMIQHLSQATLLRETVRAGYGAGIGSTTPA